MPGYTLPVLSGILLWLSFPKPAVGLVVWAALVPLFVSLEGAGPKKAFGLGFVAGFVFNLLSVSWVTVTMSRYGGLPYSASLALLVALSGYLALYFGVFGWLTALTRRWGRLPILLAAPLYWTTLELARNYMLSGFPWNLLGYSQAEYPHVIQIADITGVYGVSALIVLVNAALARLVITVKEHGRPDKLALAAAAVAACLLTAVLGYGRLMLSHPPEPDGSIRVALVQGNIDQSVKWDPAYQGEVFNTYSGLTMAAVKFGPDLIVWPETATPFYYGDSANRSKLERLAVHSHRYILTGSPAFEKHTDGSYTDYNSAFLVSPSGKTVGRYDKMHLVPFGEYVPLKKLLPFVSKMVVGIGDFGTGEDYNVIRTPDGNFGTAICFEAIFPELVRRFPLAGADFLVNITNDAWFGDSGAPYQHFNMALMRAVENRRSLVRAANTGITGVITPTGIVSARTDIYTRGYIEREIPLVRQKSFYTLHGDVFAYACSALAVVFLVLILVSTRYNKMNPKAKDGL